MKRLIGTLVLLSALSLSALAGDIPGSGKQDPPPSPSPSPTSTTTVTTYTDLQLKILMGICLTLLGA